MERALKERIIGAVVLVAVAVLVVPVFLDGPPGEDTIVRERIALPGQTADDGVTTVVLDRDRSDPVPRRRRQAEGWTPGPSETSAAAAVETRAEDAVAAVTPPPRNDQADESERREPAEAPIRNEAPVQNEAPVPSNEPPPVSEPPAATRSSTGMYAVQLGSFSNPDNAERLAAELRQQGFAAFLSQLDTPNGELHRVRIGPQKDREAAETMAARLARAGHKGQVVPHP